MFLYFVVMFTANPKSELIRPFLRISIILGILWITLPGKTMAVRFEDAHAREDSVFFFKGRVLDSLTRQPVVFTHIINEGRGTAAICDTLGYFFMRVRLQDTLIFSAIGYAPENLVITDSIASLSMIPDVEVIPISYSIRGVSINPLGSYESFKGKVATLELPPSKYQINPGVIMDIEEGIDTLDMMPVTSMSPVTALYNWLSREGKQKRRYRQMLEQEEFERRISYKFSPLVVSGITGYSGFRLYRFMDFCSFKQKFLEESDRYVIRDAVVEKQKEFEALEEESGGGTGNNY
jgi:hypothetical protein